jgi:hypothetical protein
MSDQEQVQWTKEDIANLSRKLRRRRLFLIPMTVVSLTGNVLIGMRLSWDWGPIFLFAFIALMNLISIRNIIKVSFQIRIIDKIEV